MLIHLGGGPTAPLDSFGSRLESLGHRFTADENRCDLRLWLDLGPGPRPPLPESSAPILVVTDRREPVELEALLGSGEADWLRWPEEESVLPLRMITASRRSRPAADLLTAAIAHEVNNPLTWLFANLELLERALRNDGELHHLAQDALEGAERIRSIFDGFRGLRRAAAVPLRTIEIRPVIESSCRLVEAEAQGRATIICDLAPTPPVQADATRLGQVFVNLLGNALRAMPDRPVTDNLIRVVLRPDGDQVLVEVADNGVGMSPELRARIFEPFFTTWPAGHGSGMGLPIARGIVEASGGTLEVESEPGVGSIFRVRLPARG